ncbi:hypothetical protein [Magnetospirillum gryphiswaldense]|uniref:Uncharacterized protein n=1 Tax=Magnetospirillum gryphiswaldense TaxID=55518 RepID=A4U1G7_9PROT|nr:hypothetical protein [Magnetospirillum gryphiswaldense]AVM73669.1 hypothetical protein MSR1_11740 [Magnetospirillum gryphiswaldense MSR-1]AVM77572.1 hypothetical protein MSR1L_11740 [Magnetospirillum gryphiswaldense]CAM76724.1 conserved hypothetical protein, membrane [Magnetospirillum gryphiswaldense MSR-1]
MSLRAIGIGLIWLGTLALVMVLQQRIRSGAWSQEALENPPPVERWAVPLAAIGMILAAVGAGLVMWSFV